MIDDHFRRQRLKPGLIRANSAGFLSVDIEDIQASESAKQARRAKYWVLDPQYRPRLSIEEIETMRRSLQDINAPSWQAYVHSSVDGHQTLVLKPGLCDALDWREGDRISFRQLYSGELLTLIDRRARTNENT